MKQRYQQHGDGPAFVVRSKKDYGSDYPQMQDRLSSTLATVGAICLFGALILATMLLLPGACDVEVKKQIGMAQQSQGVEQ